jgi:nicotinamide mononucleotide transporter
MTFLKVLLENMYVWMRSNYIELFATIISIVGVWLTTKQIIWCWAVSLGGIVLSLYVFFHSHLYLQALLQIFYVFMTIYGWYNWIHGGEDGSKLKICSIKKRDAIIYLITGIITIVATGYLFSLYTSDSSPWLDSLTFVCGIIATYIMAKKIMEHWLVWIFNDIIMVGMCFYQNLYIFTFLYFIFIILASYGFIEWRKEFLVHRQQTTDQGPQTTDDRINNNEK